MTITTIERAYQPGRPGLATSFDTAGYDHPDQVLRDDTLSTADKRAILSSWASDANALEQQPWLRLAPGQRQPVLLRAILDALRRLDDDEPPPKGGAAIRLRGDRAVERETGDDLQCSWRTHHDVARHPARFRPVPMPGLRRDHAARRRRAASGRA
jgi:hypothetical protein